MRSAARAALGLLVALTAGAALIGAAQGDLSAPLRAYAAMARGALGDPYAWSATLARATPLLLTGASVAAALAAGLFNIGTEGQMAVGALAAALTAFWTRSLPLGLLAGASTGALWAWLPGWLRARRGVHEVLSALLLNYVAAHLTHYLASGPWKATRTQAPQTPTVAATLPRLLADYDTHAGLLLGLGATIALALALAHTVWGYETCTVGQAPQAAEAAGIDVARTRLRAFLLSGALGGLAGAVVVLGATPFRRFPADFYGIGYGFDGLAVAMLAGGAPWGILPAALIFGGLGAGADTMSFEVGTPKQIVQVIEALLLLALGLRAFPGRKR